jgi:hypothetical protein
MMCENNVEDYFQRDSITRGNDPSTCGHHNLITRSLLQTIIITENFMACHRNSNNCKWCSSNSGHHFPAIIWSWRPHSPIRLCTYSSLCHCIHISGRTIFWPRFDWLCARESWLNDHGLLLGVHQRHRAVSSRFEPKDYRGLQLQCLWMCPLGRAVKWNRPYSRQRWSDWIALNGNKT